MIAKDPKDLIWSKESKVKNRILFLFLSVVVRSFLGLAKILLNRAPSSHQRLLLTMAIQAGETFQERTKGRDVRLSNIVAAKVSNESVVVIGLRVLNSLTDLGFFQNNDKQIMR